jgi:hypothetical protein
MTYDRKGTGFGAPALKYIKQTKQEMKLGRSIKNEFTAKQTSWGTFLEKRVFKKLLPTSYQYVANDGRLFHPDIPNYSGVPDFLNNTDTVCDGKCPFNMEKFCDKMEALQDYGTFKKEFPEDFWQLVSNLTLLRANGMEIDYIEAINYVPYRSELAEIRMSAEGDESMRWLEYTTDAGLPWLPDGGHYKNLNIHRFRVMQRDVDEWLERLTMAVNVLLDREAVKYIAPPVPVIISEPAKKPKKLSELL